MNTVPLADISLDATHLYTVFNKSRFIETDPQDSSSIFFGVISTPTSWRQGNCFKNWYRFLNYTRHSGYFLCSPPKEQRIGYQFMPLTPEYEKIINRSAGYGANQDRGSKRMMGLEYFYFNTTHDYYWSLTDDVTVDLVGVEMMIKELDQRYDPKKDKIFIGHRFPWGLQGGAGFLLSRASAKVLVSHTKEWVSNIRGPDDCESESFTKWLGLKPDETATGYIIGEDPGFLFNKTFFANDYIPCEMKPSDFYGPYPLYQLIAIHTHYIDPYLLMRHLIGGRPYLNDIYYAYNRHDIIACKGKPYGQNNPDLGSPIYMD